MRQPLVLLLAAGVACLAHAQEPEKQAEDGILALEGFYARFYECLEKREFKAAAACAGLTARVYAGLAAEEKIRAGNFGRFAAPGAAFCDTAAAFWEKHKNLPPIRVEGQSVSRDQLYRFWIRYRVWHLLDVKSWEAAEMPLLAEQNRRVMRNEFIARVLRFAELTEIDEIAEIAREIEIGIPLEQPSAAGTPAKTAATFRISLKRNAEGGTDIALNGKKSSAEHVLAALAEIPPEKKTLTPVTIETADDRITYSSALLPIDRIVAAAPARIDFMFRGTTGGYTPAKLAELMPPYPYQRIRFDAHGKLVDVPENRIAFRTMRKDGAAKVVFVVGDEEHVNPDDAVYEIMKFDPRLPITLAPENDVPLTAIFPVLNVLQALGFKRIRFALSDVKHPGEK